MMQRGHEGDLAGLLLRDAQRDGEPWHVISLPAIAEDSDPWAVRWVSRCGLIVGPSMS